MRPLPILTAPVPATAQCSGCGKCCKAAPGLFVPEDFGNDLSRMREAIAAGRVAIDWWEGERVYYLRPATKDGVGYVFHASWGGTCNHLGDAGCGLTYEARPRQCRGLVPGEPGVRNCTEPGADKRDFVAQWEEWSDRVFETGSAIEREREGCA